jgi:hypothetical protein
MNKGRAVRTDVGYPAAEGQGQLPTKGKLLGEWAIFNPRDSSDEYEIVWQADQKLVIKATLQVNERRIRKYPLTLNTRLIYSTSIP